MDSTQVIDGAIEYIESYGWCQGNLYDEDTGAACLRGALHFGAGSRLKEYRDDRDGFTYLGMDDSRFDVDAYGEANQLVTDIVQRDKNAMDIPWYNDMLSTTKEDVVAILEKAKRKA